MAGSKNFLTYAHGMKNLGDLSTEENWGEKMYANIQWGGGDSCKPFFIFFFTSLFFNCKNPEEAPGKGDLHLPYSPVPPTTLGWHQI